MKKFRLTAIWTAVLLSCILMFTFAEDLAKAVQAYESDATIVYNGKEANLGIKPVLIDGCNYLSVRIISSLFNKNIYWDQNENKILISDKTDPQLESIASELAAKNKRIEELEAKVKKLENDMTNRRKPSIRELQERINDEYGEYEGVTYRVILSGNEDEIRVKLEIDLSRDKSAWSRLTSSEKEEFIKDVCDVIAGEYGSAKIKGYFKDISASKKLSSFHYNWNGELGKSYYRNYSTISTIEDRFNDNYDGYFNGIHLTYALIGNDNRVEYTIYIQKNRFEEKWDKLSDSVLKNFMKKLCSEINGEFRECHILGYVYDTDSYSELAYCEQVPEGDFNFYREQ